MSHLGSSQWWWDVALQGVVGSAIGGLFTVAVLVATLRYQRRSDVDEVFLRECQRIFEEARVLETLAQSGAGEFITRQFRWSKDTRMLLISVNTTEPCFVALFEAVTVQLGRDSSGSFDHNGLRVVSLQRTLAGLGNAQALLQHRMFNPAYFKMTKPECDNMVEVLGTGDVFI